MCLVVVKLPLLYWKHMSHLFYRGWLLRLYLSLRKDYGGHGRLDFCSVETVNMMGMPDISFTFSICFRRWP